MENLKELRRENDICLKNLNHQKPCKLTHLKNKFKISINNFKLITFACYIQIIYRYLAAKNITDTPINYFSLSLNVGFYFVKIYF